MFESIFHKLIGGFILTVFSSAFLLQSLADGPIPSQATTESNTYRQASRSNDCYCAEQVTAIAELRQDLSEALNDFVNEHARHQQTKADLQYAQQALEACKQGLATCQRKVDTLGTTIVGLREDNTALQMAEKQCRIDNRRLRSENQEYIFLSCWLGIIIAVLCLTGLYFYRRQQSGQSDWRV